MGLLDGRVALVTGASRGIGKGIALELGAAGATVYVTGRSVRPGHSFDSATEPPLARAITLRAKRPMTRVEMRLR